MHGLEPLLAMPCSTLQLALPGPLATRARQRDQVVDTLVVWLPQPVAPSPIHRYGDQLFPKTGDAGVCVASHADVRSLPRVLSPCCRTGFRRSICLRGNPGAVDTVWHP